MKKLLMFVFVCSLLVACNKKIEETPTPVQPVNIVKAEESTTNTPEQNIQEEKNKEESYENIEENTTEEIQVNKEKSPEQVELDRRLSRALLGDIREVKMLLKKGADITNIRDYDEGGESSLPAINALMNLAIKKGDIELVKFSIDKGANVNGALIKTIELGGNKEIAEILLANKADINMEIYDEPDDSGMTALRAAVEKNDKNMIDMLLKNGAKDLVVALARPDLLPALIANGADVNESILYDATLVGMAKFQEKPKLVQFFMEHGAKDLTEEIGTSRGFSFYAWDNIDKQLVVAKATGDKELVEKLLQYDAEIQEEDEDNIFRFAARFGNAEVVKELLPNIKESSLKKFVLEEAVEEGHNSVVKVFLDSGLDKSTKEKALITAVRGDQIDIAKTILNSAIDVNTGNQFDIMQLVKNDISKRTKEEALMYASWNGNLEMVKLFLNSENINAALPDAVFHIEIVEFLLESGADVNADYALINASAKGITEVVKLLLEKGADVNKKTSEGHTALYYAKQKGYTGIVKLLESAGAKE